MLLQSLSDVKKSYRFLYIKIVIDGLFLLQHIMG